jgi:hypothetical protein
MHNRLDVLIFVMQKQVSFEMEYPKILKSQFVHYLKKQWELFYYFTDISNIVLKLYVTERNHYLINWL